MSNDWNGADRSPRGLAGAALWSLAIRGSASGLGFFTALALARLLGPAEYGAYAHALAWAHMASVAAILGLDKFLVRQTALWAAREDWASVHRIKRDSFVLLCISSFLGAAALLALAAMLRGRLEENLIQPLAATGIILPLLIMTRAGQALLLGLHRVLQGLLPEMIVRPALTLALVLVAHYAGWLTLGATGAVLINAAATLAAAAAASFLLMRAMPRVLPEYIPPRSLGRLARQAFPFALLAGLQLVNTRVDVAMLGTMVGSVETGIYNVAVHGAALVTLAMFSVNGVIAPQVARLYGAGDLRGLQSLLNTSCSVVFVLSALIAVLLVLFADTWLSLFGQEFTRARVSLALLVLGQIVGAAVGPVGLVLTMTGNEARAAWGSAVCVCTNILMNILLIPSWGMAGAATASAATVVAWNGLCGYWVFSKTGLTPGILRRRPPP